MTRICLTCPSRVLSKSPHCYACRQYRRREAWRLSKERQDDYPPHIIELRFIRALWPVNARKAQLLLADWRAKNPRMAQAALARMGRAA